MDIQSIRRARLRSWIEQRHEGVVLKFAKSIKKQQSQIADTLDGRKAFGEKVARQIEKLSGMPALWLDQPADGEREERALYHGVYLTRAGALLAAEWEKLDVSDRAEIEGEVLARVARKVRSDRRRPDDKPAPGKQ